MPVSHCETGDLKIEPQKNIAPNLKYLLLTFNDLFFALFAVFISLIFRFRNVKVFEPLDECRKLKVFRCIEKCGVIECNYAIMFSCQKKIACFHKKANVQFI